MPSSIFSSSSSRSSKSSKADPPPARRRKDEHDISNVQKINTVEIGEECVELLIIIISMSTVLKSKGKLYVSALISDGENFAMLDTTVNSTQQFTNIAGMTDFMHRTFLLRRIVSCSYNKKTNLGNVDIGFIYSERSAILEITKSDLLIKDCFSKYIPHLKFVLPAGTKVKGAHELEVSNLKKSQKVSIAAKVTGVSYEVKTMHDIREVVLTKIQIEMAESDDEFEVSCWSHAGVFLGRLLENYVGATVAFAKIDASPWSGRNASGINLAFGPDAKLRLPSGVTPKRLVHAKLPEPPTTLRGIGGFEGNTLCNTFTLICASAVSTCIYLVDLTLQLVRSVEQIDDDQWFTVAGDRNRHKVQLHLNFEEASELRKNDTISISDGIIAQSGKVINITVSNPKHIKVELQPLFTELKISDLSWRDSVESITEPTLATPLTSRTAITTPRESPSKEDRRKDGSDSSSIRL